MIAITKTICKIAREEPSSKRVFERYGIDYCCGGSIPLAEACTAKKLELETVVAALEAEARNAAAIGQDWSRASLESLSGHIVATHHGYMRRELHRLTELALKVVDRHGATTPELPVIQATLTKLNEILIQHLAQEETILFSHVVELEHAKAGSSESHGWSGTIANCVATMIQEHDAAGALIEEIRELSHNYVAPQDAFLIYHAFYEGLKDFEQDGHQHIHLENDILYPRAIDLEAAPAHGDQLS